MNKNANRWETKKFTEFCKLKHGFQFREEHFAEKGVPVIKIGNLVDGGGIREDNLTFVKPELLEQFESFKLNEGDVLMALTGGTLGKVCIFPKRDNIYLQNYRVGNFIPLENAIRDYIAQLLQSYIVQERIFNLVNEAAQPNFGKQDFDKIKIALPPIPEQKAIAHILGLMDAAINKNNQLIAQKELRKKWLMQNLLTGEKRLKGFDDKWKDIHIRDIAKEVSIRNSNGNQHIVLSCTKYDGLVPSLEYFGRKIFADDVSTYKIVPRNHFAYATNHIEEGSIGYQYMYDKALISPMYTVFKTDDSVNDIFFYKLLKSHRLIYEYNARMEGSINRRGGLRWNAFSSIKVHLPSFDEQTAIANLLQAADKEIQLLKTKTEKLQQQKKWLMQVLLTGKKRLKIE